MNLKPLRDWVIVKPDKPEEVTKGGIIIPDTAQEKPRKGEVLAVGEGKMSDDGKLIRTEVKVGDRVFYSKYSGHEIKVDDEEYLFLPESDIYAIIK